MTDRKAARWPAALIVIVTIACLAGGSVLLVSGAMSHPPAAASLPVSQFAVRPGALGTLPPLRPGPITVTGAMPGRPGTRCSIAVTRSRLVIPSLCVSGPIVLTEMQRDGALVIPRDVREIAMWDGGAQLSGPAGRLVRLGTTLLAGHVDYAGQGDGTLFDLYQVQPGAVVYTSDASGHVARWRVTSLIVAVKSHLPSWVFAGPAGARKLVIVTCGGPVDYVQGHGYSYADNVIATAIPG